MRGEDFLMVILKPTAPDYVGYCSKRYVRIFERKDQPFRLTRAEYEAYFAKRGWFEPAPEEAKPETKEF